MQTLTRRMRNVAVAAAGLAAAWALTVPAAAAHAATGGYSPNPDQWYFSKWDVQQDVWPVTQGAGVTVAVVDTGVQAIPDLRGVLQSGGDMLGEPGNGEKDYSPDGGHGTAVAALIAGQGAGAGPVGIAPQAKVLPVHVFQPGGGTPLTIANGIKYAVSHGAKIINISVGENAGSPTSCDSTEQAAVSYAISHDVVIVAASGDNSVTGSEPSEPASCAGVLAVGAVEQNGSLWPGSTQGPNVSVAAPGDHLYTVSSNGQQVSVNSSGTSFSAPLVAGAAALIRSKYPSMPWYQVDQRLIDTAIPVGSVPNNATGYGIIDIAKAIDASRYPVKASAPNPPYARYQDYLKSTGQSSSSGQGGGAASSASPKSSKGSSLGIIVAIVVIVILLAVVALVIVLVARGRKRRGPRNPGGGGGYPPNPYGHPAAPGQYPPPGQQYPQGQYQPGPYQQQYPPAQPPGQYPPPHQ